MLERQSHRGPDHTGLYDLTHNGILGHNRLSIIDLNAAANQPFLSADGRYVMVFNGEIYNCLELRAELEPHFPFRTHSDTEVLLNAFIHWGPRCLDRFNGMFSFAIWDQQQQSLFAARDRFGVKPFHYAIHQNALYFASEIKALWAAGIPRTPRASVWAGYLSYGTYGMPDETFWDGLPNCPPDTTCNGKTAKSAPRAGTISSNASNLCRRSFLKKKSWKPGTAPPWTASACVSVRTYP